jgi:hypothetical protein
LVKLLVWRYDSKVWTAIYTERDGKIRIISVRRGRTKTKQSSTGSLGAGEFDRRFDEGESIFALGMKAEDATKLGMQRVNLDLPQDFLAALDGAAITRGVARQALIKSWLYDRLTEEALRTACGKNIKQETGEQGKTSNVNPQLARVVQESLMHKTVFDAFVEAVRARLDPKSSSAGPRRWWDAR